MEVSENVWNLVNNRADTRGFLATADMEGKCDAACFNSLRLADRHTMTVTLSPNRSLANLKANPRAAFAMTTGESVQDVDGCRVYLLVREIVEGGPVLEEPRRTTAEQMGLWCRTQTRRPSRSTCPTWERTARPRLYPIP